MYETELSRDRRHDPALKHYLDTIGRFSLLTPRREQELARQVREGDQEALDELVNANLRFVVSVARRFTGRGLGLMDLIAEGNVGLITAARRFDERRGFRFVTYAVWWIRQAIQTALQDKVRTVRLPANRMRQATRIQRRERELEQDRQGTVPDEDLAAGLEIDPEQIGRIRAALRPHLDLDEPLAEGMPLREILADPADPGAHRTLEQSILTVHLGRALADLDARERSIVTGYFGIGDQPARSLEALARNFGLSRERVRQIRNRAFAKLRSGTEGRILEDLVG